MPIIILVVITVVLVVFTLSALYWFFLPLAVWILWILNAALFRQPVRRPRPKYWFCAW